MSTNSEIVPAPAHPAAAAFMPVMAMQQAIERYNAVLSFTKTILKEGKDYGAVPGSDRPSLLKPGAEKLCSFFGLAPRFLVVEKTEIWDGDEPFFYYWFKCQLYRGDVIIAEGDGSCNSHESKYRYRWVSEDQIPPGFDPKRLMVRAGRVSEYEFAIERAETTGKYGKPAAYWQAFKDAIANKTATRIQKRMKDTSRPAWEIDSTVYRVPNPDIPDQANTFLKMAQKRALIAASLIACNASEFYTQDLEDLETIDVDYTAEPDPPPQARRRPPAPAEQSAAGPRPVENQRQSHTLDEVLATFRDTKSIESAFGQMREHFLRFYPEDVYDQIMRENGLGKGEPRTVGKAKKAFTALWNTARQALEDQAAAAGDTSPEEP